MVAYEQSRHVALRDAGGCLFPLEYLLAGRGETVISDAQLRRTSGIRRLLE